MKKILLIFITFLTFINVSAKEIDTYSKNIVLYNLNDDTVIYEKNKDDKTSIASMTKIMTVLVAIENIEDLNEKVTLTKEVFKGLIEANASVAGFKVGDVVTYEDLLYGAFLPSGADATNALAINLVGDIDKFVNLMNEKAKELNLKNTHFANTTGLDDELHYSTVNDVAIILKNALKNDTFKEIFMKEKYLTSNKLLTFTSTLTKSLKTYNIDAPYIIGGKTGYTLDAGRCLASIAHDVDNDIYYLLVTANAKTTTNYYHLLDAKNIYEYYIDNYKYFDLIKEGDIITSINTKYAKEKEVAIISTQTIKKYLKNDFNKDKLEIKYDGVDTINYNTKIDSKLGVVYLIYDGVTLASFDALLNTNLHFSIFNFMINNILFIILFIIFIFITIKLKKRKKKRYKKRVS